MNPKKLAIIEYLVNNYWLEPTSPLTRGIMRAVGKPVTKKEKIKDMITEFSKRDE